MSSPVQPLIHDGVIVLRAPTQVWSARDGSIGDAAIHGVTFSDMRLVQSAAVQAGEQAGEHIATLPRGSDSITFVALQRHLDDRQADPRVRTLHSRTATINGVDEELVIESDLTEEITTEVQVTIRPDLTDINQIKGGAIGRTPDTTIDGRAVRWGNQAITATLVAADATITELASGEIRLTWPVTVPPRGSARLSWNLVAADSRAVVRGAAGPAPWSVPSVVASDDRLGRWLGVALSDLDALRLSPADHPEQVFLAAGAPWFFTLFGRDSLWAARMMLPLGTRLAGDTLRILARLQGSDSVAETAEQPGKIMHELRRDSTASPRHGFHLPPLYYGTVDATPLWVCLLHDAWRWGLPEAEVQQLLPHAVRALEWMRDYGDADGDGLLEYVDSSGQGLANQGWKDSGDSVQWRDGTLADGPIALCEVQAYAYEAAVHGAELLDHFGVEGAQEWREWASALKARFHENYWIESADGAYPAIALDAAKRPVDTVTSNLGHLLGTGLLDADQSALVARRLLSPELNSGYGVRTMSTDSAGYWPLSYHGGSVWTHDTAIAIAGLARDGFTAEAGVLISGLLDAASGFDYRMPELHSGDAATEASAPIPYPAACRPQAWSATAAVSVLASALGLKPDAERLRATPTSALGAMTVSGLRFHGAEVTVDASGVVGAG